MKTENATKPRPLGPNIPNGTEANARSRAVERSATEARRFNEDLETASKDLEAFFIQNLLREFRKNPVGEGGLFPETTEVEFYKDMRDRALSEKLSEAGGLGLGKFVYEQLKRKPNEEVFPSPDFKKIV